jgi:transposase
MTTKTRYSQEVRKRVIRMLFKHQQEYDFQWAALSTLASKIGCTTETLPKWVRYAKIHQGIRNGLTATECERLRQLEMGNGELDQAKEIPRKAAA